MRAAGGERFIGYAGAQNPGEHKTLSLKSFIIIGCVGRIDKLFFKSTAAVLGQNYEDILLLAMAHMPYWADKKNRLVIVAMAI